MCSSDLGPTGPSRGEPISPRGAVLQGDGLSTQMEEVIVPSAPATNVAQGRAKAKQTREEKQAAARSAFYAEADKYDVPAAVQPAIDNLVGKNKIAEALAILHQVGKPKPQPTQETANGLQDQGQKTPTAQEVAAEVVRQQNLNALTQGAANGTTQETQTRGQEGNQVNGQTRVVEGRAQGQPGQGESRGQGVQQGQGDRKSTRLNSSHT